LQAVVLIAFLGVAIIGPSTAMRVLGVLAAVAQAFVLVFLLQDICRVRRGERSRHFRF